MWKRLLFLISGAALLSGCAALQTPKYARVIPQVDKPLIEIQRAVVRTLPQGLGSTSANGREFHSKPFALDKSGGFKGVLGGVAERYVANLTVLGDQRPYNIEISVNHENRKMVNGLPEYVVVGHDMDVAHQLEKKLHEELAKRREDRNIIDDFRVF